ncbi:zona pellucida sperm-binding protein 4-like isoform X2 [Emydura macquarii macquarii]|uniref:zona pellucida sperm-binding protein 4-like isoform X2 n=1 Tax=Emydura macquarii macquarii TaxID=1129001 RepID=UPI00352BCFD6
MVGVWHGGAVCFWVLYCSFALGLGVQGGPRQLVCGQRSLQFILPPGQARVGSLALTAWDTAGRLHALQNDSSCGVWVSLAADGSRRVDASYAGCFVSEWNGQYLMVVGTEGMAAGGRRALHEEKVLRCPRSLPALDAPSPSVCAAIQSQDRLPCASPPITHGDCEGRGCCFDPSDRVKPCYYGNTVTAQCTPDGQFSIAVSQDVTLPPLILDSVHLASGRSAGCVPVAQNNAFVLFQFPLSACGTIFRMAGDQGVYENELVADRDVRTWSLGSITRDSTFRLHVRCSYSTSGNFLPLSVQVFTLSPPPAVSEPGPLALELRIATGARTQETTIEPSWSLWELPQGYCSHLTTSASSSAPSPLWSLPPSGHSQGRCICTAVPLCANPPGWSPAPSPALLEPGAEGALSNTQRQAFPPSPAGGLCFFSRMAQKGMMLCRALDCL